MSHTAHALAALTRTPSSRFAVSMWHLPFESVTDAVVVTGYFDAEDAAEAFARPNQNPPEMASVMPIASHDRILAKVYADVSYPHQSSGLEGARREGRSLMSS